MRRMLHWAPLWSGAKRGMALGSWALLLALSVSNAWNRLVRVIPVVTPTKHEYQPIGALPVFAAFRKQSAGLRKQFLPLLPLKQAPNASRDERAVRP